MEAPARRKSARRFIPAQPRSLRKPWRLDRMRERTRAGVKKESSIMERMLRGANIGVDNIEGEILRLQEMWS